MTEFVPIADPEAARTFAERKAFERSTGLTDIGAAHPESYGHLATMIEAYRREHDMQTTATPRSAGTARSTARSGTGSASGG